jgi:hypothetical protein
MPGRSRYSARDFGLARLLIEHQSIQHFVDLSEIGHYEGREVDPLTRRPLRLLKD